MSDKARQVSEFEGELVRLHLLVRERRKQLARLEKCPNKDCPCRFIWRENVEKNLASQVGNVRRQVQALARSSAAPKRRSRRPQAK